MDADNILILRDLDKIYTSLYDLFNKNFTCIGDKQFTKFAIGNSNISYEVNKDFHLIIIVEKNKIQELKLDPLFFDKFEKHLINFEMFINQRDRKIANKIIEYITIISSYNNNENLKLDLGKLLINCEKNNIEGLIYKIENDEELSENIDSTKYEIILIEKIFNKIVPTFCQDIIASILSSNYDSKYHLMNEIVIKAYKKYSYINFELFFEKIEKKKNIIYTFSKVNENIFTEKQLIKNKFGTYSKSSTKTEIFESIKSENDLIYLLKEFFNSNNKNLFILRFTENDLHKVNYANYIIYNFEKGNECKNKKDKLIIFIIHMKRHKKCLETKKINSDLITFFNDEYYQIFIDNLNGKKNWDFYEMISKKADNLTQRFKKYINKEFIDNNIYKILSYFKYNILYPTEDLNSENFSSKIKDKIINNRKLKKIILNNLKEQGKSFMNIINEIFTSEINEVPGTDFMEVIDNKLNDYFNRLLLNIINYFLNKNILIPILNEQNLDKFLNDSYFEDLINSEFDKESFNFDPQLKLEIKANMILIYNGLSIPQSNIYFDKIINYINEKICPNYIENEKLLRKNNLKEEEILVYNEKLEKLERDIKIELNKYEFFQNIQNNNDLRSMLLEDYLKYFIMTLLENDEIDCKYNESLYTFLKNIIKIKLGEDNSTNYNFRNTIDEFIKIIILTQGYKNDIKDLFNIFIDIKKFWINIEHKLCNISNGNIIKYEISDKNKEYKVIEYLARALLLYSANLSRDADKKLKINNSIKNENTASNEKIKIYNNSIDNENDFQNITLIKKENEDYKNKINELENKIKKLELIIKKKDNIINEYNKIKESKNISNNNFENINRIKELEKEIEKFKAYCLLPGEELFTIKFISIDQKINYNTVAKNTDNFAKLESSLYDKYPKYKETENYFLVNGNKLNKHKTLVENKIKDNDILTLGIFDE